MLTVCKNFWGHTNSASAWRERDKHSKRDRLEEDERERGEKGSRPLSPAAAVASFFIVADNE